MIPLRYIISGIPATGKTTFGNWLMDNRGFAHLNIERSQLLRDVINLYNEQGIQYALELLKRQFGGREKFVLTWGHDASHMCLEIVAAMRDEHGFQAWWFTGPVAAARKEWILRERQLHPNQPDARFDMEVARFDAQIRRIESQAEALRALYANHTLRTLADDHSRISPTEIAATIGIGL